MEGLRETLLFDNPAYLYTVTRPHAHDATDYFFHPSLLGATHVFMFSVENESVLFQCTMPVLTACFTDKKNRKHVSHHVLHKMSIHSPPRKEATKMYTEFPHNIHKN